MRELVDLEVRSDAALGARRFPLVELVFGRDSFEADAKRAVYEHPCAAKHRVAVDERERRRSELGDDLCELGRERRHVECFGQLDATCEASCTIVRHRYCAQFSWASNAWQALLRCDMAFFSAGSCSPNVRPSPASGTNSES